MSGCERRLDCPQLIELTLVISSQERQAILERLFHRNFIRREIGMRPLNILEAYKRKIRMVTEQRYDEIIQPYVDAAFSKVDWPNSFSGRLLLGVKTYHQCAARCEQQTGHANPRNGVPDILSLIHQHVAPLP